MLAAGAGEFAIDVLHGTIAAAISLVVEIDGEHRRVIADVEPASIGLVNLNRVGIDHIFPAVIFEVACHDVLLSS